MGESWREERDRIVQLLQGIEAGTVTHVDRDGDRQLQSVDARNIAVLRKRLANLNVRLGT